MAGTPPSPQVTIRRVCSEPQTRRNKREEENGWGQTPQKDERSLSSRNPCDRFKALGVVRAGFSNSDCLIIRPLSRVQMTGQGPRTVRRLSPACFMASERQVPDGQHDPSPASPVNAAVGARKSSGVPRGRLTPGGAEDLRPSPRELQVTGGALADTESPRAAQGAPLVEAQRDRCSGAALGRRGQQGARGR